MAFRSAIIYDFDVKMPFLSLPCLEYLELRWGWFVQTRKVY